MGEAEVIGDDLVGALASLEYRLLEIGAKSGARQEGMAGNVDSNMRAWVLPDGAKIEIWSDNWTPLSLRGEPVLINELASSCGLELSRD